MRMYLFVAEADPGPDGFWPADPVWAEEMTSMSDHPPRVGDQVAPPGYGRAVCRVVAVHWYYGADPFVRVLAVDAK